jgi:Rad3-related DNA helicase
VQQGNIVVVDEAHNLVDAINEMYSTQLTLRQVLAVATRVSGLH